MSMNEFQVNDSITLKLENGITNIYVRGRLFKQCKFLLLNKLHIEDIKGFVENFTSVDDTIKELNWSLENKKSHEEISPETEFWAHCSNLQAWAENGYNTRFMHRNLAFPLLKKLSEEGNPLAKIKLKEEIVKRLESGNYSVIHYLIENKYIQYINKNELFYAILELEEADVLLELEQWSPHNYSLVPNFKILHSKDNKKHVHYAINKKRVIDIELLFEKSEPSTFPNFISKLRHLKTLYIHINELVDRLPSPTTIFNSLEELRIFSYGETTLPDSFDRFPNLKRLYIYGGYFETTPESLGTLKNLNHLSINRTSLRYLPESIEKLKNLEILNLRHCDLWDLPKKIIKLKNIKKLQINSVLLDDKIEKWLKSLNLVQTSIYTTSKYKYLIIKKERLKI